MVVSWRAPGLSLYARDQLMRIRGPLPAPEEIIIIAIDEPSLARFGRFPWPRSLMAQALDKLAAARPAVIVLDLLYSDPTSDADDEALAESIRRAGNVVVAAQLINASTGTPRAVWLRPLPAIERAAAGVGHVNVLTDQDGVARALLLRQADDEASALWALAIETVRVADGVGQAEVRQLPEVVRAGARAIPIEADPRTLVVAPGSSAESLRASRMMIDYLGPSGTFARQTRSFADLIDNRVSPEQLRGKYVLVGATAAGLGERLASPFMRHEESEGNQHATLMPGVEVLANAVHTILRARFYSETPDWLAALCAALVAAALMSALSLAQGRYELIKQLSVLSGLSAFVLFSGYVAFTRWLIAPPLVPALGSLLTAAPLTLLRRSLAMSADLDRRIAELQRASIRMTPSAHLELTPGPAPVALIAQLAEASAVAILARLGSAKVEAHYRLLAWHGAPLAPAMKKEDRSGVVMPQPPCGSVAEALARDEVAAHYFLSSPGEQELSQQRALALRLGEDEKPLGALILACSAHALPDHDTLSLCKELATSYLTLLSDEARRVESDQLLGRWLQWPRGVEWKAQALGRLQQRLLERASFVDRALRSIEDGLIVAGVDGSISFANPRAAQIFGLSEQALIGSNLFARVLNLPAARRELEGESPARLLRDTLKRLLLERAPVERELTLSPNFSNTATRYYTLRLAAVCESGDGEGAVIGIVATLSDITRQRELQQMKNDVMALVTHELRTPLTAIQGMSEVLSQFELAAEQRREMHLAINDEAKRLARMIDEYLDITRLESGARPLRLAPVRVAALLDRALLMLEPIAAQREIRILRRFAPNLPAVLADADLLARAVSNLVTNAIKYSPAKTEVILETRLSGERGDELKIEVADHGYGIPPGDLERIFEKFYRVPRVEDADVPGTGLGLAFVREVAELHGGRITVESELGVGSVFTLHLPINV
jgi:signal transduction histidine kinase/CHASE2 domain-containing sensor protein